MKPNQSPKRDGRAARVFVLENFQRMFIWSQVRWVAAVSAVLAGIGYYWMATVGKRIVTLVESVSPTLAAELADTFQHTLFGLFAVIGVIFASVVVQSVVFSTQLAGPVRGILRHFSGCALRGKLTPLKLRQGDWLIEIEREYNQALEANGKSHLGGASGGTQEERRAA
jgi:hypothetical protein